MGIDIDSQMKHTGQFTIQLHRSRIAQGRCMQKMVQASKGQTLPDHTITLFSSKDSPALQIKGINYSQTVVIRKPGNIAESFSRLHHLLMPSK